MTQNSLDWLMSGFYANERLRKRFTVLVRTNSAVILMNRERYRDIYVTVARTSEKTYQTIAIVNSRAGRPSRMERKGHRIADSVLSYLEGIN